jgi:hypothetical protein
VHAELRDTTVNRPDTRRRTQHRPDSATAAAIVANLEDLELGVDFADANVAVDAALEDGGAHCVSRHVSVTVS